MTLNLSVWKLQFRQKPLFLNILLNQQYSSQYKINLTLEYKVIIFEVDITPQGGKTFFQIDFILKHPRVSPEVQ